VQQGTISRHLARNAALTIVVNNFNVIYFMCLKVIIIPTRIQGSNFLCHNQQYLFMINMFNLNAALDCFHLLNC